MNQDLIEILNVEPVQKNNILARFDVYVKPWDFEILGMSYCEKGEQRWVMNPSRAYEKDGETKYQEMGRFRDPKRNRRFLDQVKAAFRKYLEGNPNMEPEPAVTEDEEIPF